MRFAVGRLVAALVFTIAVGVPFTNGTPANASTYLAGTFVVHAPLTNERGWASSGGQKYNVFQAGSAIRGELQGAHLKFKVEQVCEAGDQWCLYYSFAWRITSGHDVLWGGCVKDPNYGCFSGGIENTIGKYLLKGTVQGGVGRFAQVTGGQIQISGQFIPDPIDGGGGTGTARVTLTLN